MSANRTVILSEQAYRRIQGYAQIANVSVESAASDAIAEWMNTTGELVIEALQKKRKAEAAKPKLTLVWSAQQALEAVSNL